MSVTGPVGNLDDLCPQDGRPIGDHTLREWNEHVFTEHTDLPYEPTEGAVPFRVDDGHGEQLQIADTIVARATVLGAPDSLLKISVGCALLDFEVCVPDASPRLVTRVGLVGPPETLRKMGVLLRDTAYGAANAAERAA